MRPGSKIGLEQTSPAVVLGFGYLRVAVAGQIDKIGLFIDGEKVDMDGLTGLTADTSEVAAVQNLVNGRRFTDVRLTGENDLGQAVGGKVSGFDRRANKLSIVQIEHSVPSLSLTAAGWFGWNRVQTAAFGFPVVSSRRVVTAGRREKSIAVSMTVSMWAAITNCT